MSCALVWALNLESVGDGREVAWQRALELACECVFDIYIYIYYIFFRGLYSRWQNVPRQFRLKKFYFKCHWSRINTRSVNFGNCLKKVTSLLGTLKLVLRRIVQFILKVNHVTISWRKNIQIFQREGEKKKIWMCYLKGHKGNHNGRAVCGGWINIMTHSLMWK